MTRLFPARLHWGKYFPLSNLDIEGVYPRLPEFRALCRQVDPNGVFRNEFTERVI
jgi:xylitol oxidase